MNWLVSPFATLGFVGVTAIDTSVAGVTVSAVEPDTAPDVAVIVALPVATVLARPLEPAALLIVAMVWSAEPQVAVVVRSCVELSV